MATITRKWTGTSAQKTQAGWVYREIFTVTGVANKEAAVLAVIAAHPTHPDNPNFFINDPEGTHIGLLTWDVSATYTMNATLTDDDPLNQATIYRGDFEIVPRRVDRDRFGNPIVNSAGDPFDPSPTESHTIFVLYCRRNIPSFNIADGIQFTGAVNDGSFVLPGAGTVGAGNCLCRYYKPISDWKYGDDFVTVEGCFAFDDGTNPHDFKPLDAGRNGWLDGTTLPGTRRGAFVAENGLEPGFDVRLDGTGKPIGDFQVRDGPQPSDPIEDPTDPPSLPTNLFIDPDLSTAEQKVLIWETKKRADFSTLPF